MSNAPALHSHSTSLQDGFNMLALAATFLAAIQAQVMSISINTELDKQTMGVCAANSLFLGGLMIDVTTAFLAFLTSRWFHRLTDEEKIHLETMFGARSTGGRRNHNKPPTKLAPKQSMLGNVANSWFAMSLFAAMPLLVTGVFCMTSGILVYAWSQHNRSVAIVTTVAHTASLAFVVGILLIGRDESRRKDILYRLSTKWGDW